MTTPSETPRTDAMEEKGYRFYNTNGIPPDFSRTLERELNAAQAEARELREALEKLHSIADALYLGAYAYAKPPKEREVTNALQSSTAVLAKHAKEGEG